MKIQHFGGVTYFDTMDDLVKILQIRYGDDVNEFWITNEDEENPCLAILVNKNYANVSYFPKAGHLGFQSIGNIKDLSPNGYSVFYTNTPEEELEISNEMIILFEQALVAAKEFVITKEKPTSIDWYEL